MATLSIGLMPKIVAVSGPKRPLVGGTILFTAGLIWFARAPLDGQFLIDIMPPMFLLGLGAGLTFTPLALIANARVEPGQAGLLSGLPSAADLNAGYHLAFWVA